MNQGHRQYDNIPLVFHGVVFPLLGALIALGCGMGIASGWKFDPVFATVGALACLAAAFFLVRAAYVSLFYCYSTPTELHYGFACFPLESRMKLAEIQALAAIEYWEPTLEEAWLLVICDRNGGCWVMIATPAGKQIIDGLASRAPGLRRWDMRATLWPTRGTHALQTGGSELSDGSLRSAAVTGCVRILSFDLLSALWWAGITAFCLWMVRYEFALFATLVSGWYLIRAIALGWMCWHETS